MSGGSYNYAYMGIEQTACEVRIRAEGNPLRLAFAAHLDLVAKALHDLEWVDSSDYAHGDEVVAIRECLGGDGPVLAEIERQVAALAATVAEIRNRARPVRDLCMTCGVAPQCAEGPYCHRCWPE